MPSSKALLFSAHRIACGLKAWPCGWCDVLHACPAAGVTFLMRSISAAVGPLSARLSSCCLTRPSTWDKETPMAGRVYTRDMQACLSPG